MKPYFTARRFSVAVGSCVLILLTAAFRSLFFPNPCVKYMATVFSPSRPVVNPILRPVEDRTPHPACSACFTMATTDQAGRHQIYEKMPSGEIIPRHIPNPAPLRLGEVREEFDEDTGEAVWYIGHQRYVGPTDEEPISDEFPVPKIELLRIKTRHEKEICALPNIGGFGIGPRGLFVSFNPHYAESADRVPREIEGVPVEIVVSDTLGLGEVYDRIPHPACPNCFTIARYCSGGRYQIFERMLVEGKEVIISRQIPNPAPLRPGEVREEFDKATGGEPVWYIEYQAYVGPTDEEPFSDKCPVPQIELQRIQWRHMDGIFGVPGVHGFGIGARGFSVSITPEHAENTALIPPTLEGIPVEVEVSSMARLL